MGNPSLRLLFEALSRFVQKVNRERAARIVFEDGLLARLEPNAVNEKQRAAVKHAARMTDAAAEEVSDLTRALYPQHKETP